MRNFLIALALSTVTTGAIAAPFTLSSSSFKEGDIIATKYGGNLASVPSCAGQNVSPALSWSDVPEGTTSIVLMTIDPEARGGGVTHWIAYGIDPAKGGLREGEVSQAAPGVIGGKGVTGLDHWFGPCPPANVSLHHYVFIAVATDLPRDALPAGLTREEVAPKLAGHIKATSSLAVRFRHP